MLYNQEHLTRLRKSAWGYDDMVTGGGAMETSFAKKLFQATAKKAKVMSQMNMFATATQTFKIGSLAFASNVLQPGEHGQPLPDAYTTQPTWGKQEYTTGLYKGKVKIPDGIFEDNVEEEQLRNTVRRMMSEAINGDMEWIAFEGDTASTTPALAVKDGLFKLATSHDKDAGGAALSLTIFQAAWRLLPSQFRDQKSSMVFWGGANAVEDYGDSLTARESKLGDETITGWDGPFFKKMPVIDVPKIREDLPGTQTHGLMLKPANASIAVWKRVELEPWRDADSGAWVLIVRLRMGMGFAEEDGVVEISALAA
jgi:hypothetical protein